MVVPGLGNDTLGSNMTINFINKKVCLCLPPFSGKSSVLINLLTNGLQAHPLVKPRFRRSFVFLKARVRV